MPTNPIITFGIDALTRQALAGEGFESMEASADALSGLIQSYPDAVLLVEEAADHSGSCLTMNHQDSSLKVIQIGGSEEALPDYGEALKSHLFGVFRRPLDLESLMESIRDAQQIQSWSDGIEVLSARPNWLTLSIRCRRYTADRLVRFVREMVSDIDTLERERIGTAFREILLNGMEHGAAFDASKVVYVSCLRTDRFLMYAVRDPGPGFSFDNLPQAAISNPANNPVQHLLYREQQGIRAGGFGLMITKNLVDEMLYNEAGNEVVLIKYLNWPAATG